MNTKQLTLKWFDEVWNQKNSGFISEMMDSSTVGMTESGEFKGPDGLRAALYEPFIRAFPDVHVTVDRIIAEGDEVAVRWTAVATHLGPLMSLSASGKRIRFSGMSWIRFKSERIAEGYDSYNMQGLLDHLAGGPPSASVQSF